MKKSLLSLAILSTFAIGGVAHAQSNVQVYGLLDAGMEVLNHSGATNSTNVKVISGGKNTSRWGLRGSEDLGGGLKAVFNLEGGILMDTGNLDGVLFKRQANVGLEGAFGKVVIGRSFTTTYDLVLAFDPLGYAPNYSWGTSANASGPSKYGMTTAFDNLIKYSGNTGDFKYGFTYGAGEVAGSAADGRKYSTGASWSHSGLSLMASYEQINGATVVATGRRDETTAIHAAADYRTGAWRLGTGLRSYKVESGKAATADVKADTVWAGVSYLVQPNVTLTGAVYSVNVKNVAPGKDADPIMYVARTLVAMSKRTTLYVSAAYAKAKNNQLVSLSRDDAGAASTQTGLTAGIQHRF